LAAARPRSAPAELSKAVPWNRARVRFDAVGRPDVPDGRGAHSARPERRPARGAPAHRSAHLSPASDRAGCTERPIQGGRGSPVPRAFAIRPAARSVWPRTSDLGALDLSARSGADRVYDAVADQAGVGASQAASNSGARAEDHNTEQISDPSRAGRTPAWTDYRRSLRCRGRTGGARPVAHPPGAG
jgi:hypothetical protein